MSNVMSCACRSAREEVDCVYWAVHLRAQRIRGASEIAQVAITLRFVLYRSVELH
ncbi:hypothetical protein Z948_992 [Sulfitobacter donghicola DSW-25 = KCTC 12864 = JCM 14565]|nr:hypothetical protein Z948_992 [Sulfitobacter donghicola DSW-25 = KCTC 12864 = JCM 14565]